VLFATFVIGCDRPTQSAGELETVQLELPHDPDPIQPPTDRFDRKHWRLTEGSSALRFSLGPVERSSAPLAECVPLKNGDVLAAFTDSGEYDFSTWFLELRLAQSRWTPHAVGFYTGGCTGFWWYEDLQGQITVDDRDPGALRCQLDISGVGIGGSRRERLSKGFRVDPRSDSVGLRNFLSGYRLRPKLK